MPNFTDQIVDCADPAASVALAILAGETVPSIPGAITRAEDAQWWLRAVWLDAFRAGCFPSRADPDTIRRAAQDYCGF